MSAAARARISKATKARWAKFRAAKAKGKHQSLLENGCKRPRKISRKSNREAARYYSYGVTLKSNRVRARGLLLFPATYCQSQSPGWTATFPQNADRLGWKRDRKSTRLNSSHSQISYAVFCLKKKTKQPPTVSIDEVIYNAC